MRWLSLLWLALLVLPGQAQPEGEVGDETLYILVTNAAGKWTAEQQNRFRPPEALGEGSELSTDWKELLRTPAMSVLSYSHRTKLLERPERLLSSSWAPSFFKARHIMVTKPLEDGRVSGRLFDLESGDEEAIIVAGKTRNGKEARGSTVAEASEMADLAKTPVAAHPESGLYHKTGAAHLSPRVSYTELSSSQRAEISGLKACRICFPETDRSILYDRIDRRLGLIVSRNIELRYRLAPEGPQAERVRRIGKRLLKENRLVDQGYRFILLDSDTINAFAAPTGPLYVTTGMLDILESDDELAAILGHELSHSERRHARKQYERSRKAGFLGILVTVATRIPWARLGSDVLSTILSRGYSRGYELEADRDGMMTAYAAGYVPQDFLLVQEKLAQLAEQNGGAGPAWLRTHPRGKKRLERLQDLLAKTKDLRTRLNEFQKRDPGLARHLKSKVLEFADDQTDIIEFLDAYQGLLSRAETLAGSMESDDEPSSSQPDTETELWDALDLLITKP